MENVKLYINKQKIDRIYSQRINLIKKVRKETQMKFVPQYIYYFLKIN